MSTHGAWPLSDLRRAFVDGATYEMGTEHGWTPWPADRDVLEAEAERRYPGGQPRAEALGAPEARGVAAQWDGPHRLLYVDLEPAAARSGRRPYPYAGRVLVDRNGAGEVVGIELLDIARFA